MTDLKKLEKADFSMNTKLNNIRNIFFIQIYTALRYSDLKNLKPENFDLKENIIKINTTKTTKTHVLPITKELKKILKNYPDLILPVVSNQKYNVYLKEACKITGIDNPIQITNYYGKERKDQTKLKYELVTSHTARRTAITLALKKGVLPEYVMIISGYQDRRSYQ
jgi:integrase